MIPLSRWLVDAGNAEGALPWPEQHTGMPAAEPEQEPCLVFTSDDLEAAFTRGRAEAEAEAELRIADAIASERAHWEDRIRELAAEHSSQCGEALAASVEQAFTSLRLSIESPLAEVLLPFVNERIFEKARTEMVRLLSREIGESASPVIEVRAPEDLHGILAESLRARGYSATLSDAETIEVINQAGASRFVSLARDWINSLEGACS